MPLTALGISKDGFNIAIGSYFGDLKGIDIRKEQSLIKFTGDNKRINEIHFLPCIPEKLSISHKRVSRTNTMDKSRETKIPKKSMRSSEIVNNKSDVKSPSLDLQVDAESKLISHKNSA